jgi:nicotinate dehydrogenase subunit A
MPTLDVNGRQVTVDVAPTTPLVYVLRNDLKLNGPKLGCARGQCGACMVHLDGKVAYSCQTSVEKAQGKKIVTLEGLGTPDKPHPVQAAFIAEQAMQCGYCTSGMIMHAAALLNEKPNPTELDVKLALNDNLCRCGSQPRVVRAVLRAARSGT